MEAAIGLAAICLGGLDGRTAFGAFAALSVLLGCVPPGERRIAAACRGSEPLSQAKVTACEELRECLCCPDGDSLS